LLKVELIRLEGSGGHLVRDILKANKHINVTSHSFPKLMGEERSYPDVPITDALCVVCRDTSIQIVSVVKRGYNSLTPDKFPIHESIAAITNVVEAYIAANKPVIFFSYETVIRYRKLYLENIFKQLQVPYDDYDFTAINYIDGNCKYLKDKP